MNTQKKIIITYVAIMVYIHWRESKIVGHFIVIMYYDFSIVAIHDELELSSIDVTKSID